MVHNDEKAALRAAHPELEFIPGGLLMKSGPQDYIGAALAVRGTLYFDGSDTPEVRAAICDCFERYELIAREHLTWLWREDPPSGPKKFTYPKAPPMRKMMDQLRPDDFASFAYSSGAKAEDAGQWMFFVHGLRAWEAKVGTFGLAALTFSLPPVFVEEHPMIVQTMFVEFARALNAVHGFGGFAFNLSLVRGEPNEPTEAFMAAKMNGLDVGNPIGMGIKVKYGIQDHLKTIGWLTAINTAMLEQVGGIATLQSELPKNWFAKYDYGSGIVIQAGPAPQVVPVHIDPRPALCVLPNMLLKDVRMTGIDAFHYGSKDGEPRLTGWSAEQWLQRFDVDSSELLQYKAKLLDEPRVTPATTLAAQL